MQTILQNHARQTLRSIRSIHDIHRAIDAAPINVQRKGSVLRAVIRLPSRTGKPLTLVATIDLARPTQEELGWFGSSFVRKVKRKLTHTFPRVARMTRTVIKMGKRMVKSKVLKAVWKSMPLWANLIPPPVGTSLAAGAAAAQAAIAIAKKAKAGSESAIAFVKGARDIARGAKSAVRDIKAAKGKPSPELMARARAVAMARANARAAFGRVAVAARKQDARLLASADGRSRPRARPVARKPVVVKGPPVYTVRTPDGKVLRVAASRVAA